MNKFAMYTLSQMGRRDRATEYLAEQLRRKQLVLLLGAGISVGVGLPGWGDLIAHCEAAEGLPKVTKERNHLELMQAADHLQDMLGARLPATVHDALYSKVAGTEYPFEIITRPLLIAIGALVQRSTRGSVAEVISMNFDDLLESYLAMLGSKVEIVADYSRLIPHQSDVTSYHPHGFLPLNPQRTASQSIVLGHSDFMERMAGIEGTAWATFLADRLATRTLLVVGSSMSDMDLELIVRKVNNETHRDTPAGFVVMKEPTEETVRRLERLNFAVVALGDHSETPPFLLEICRRAANSA